MDKKYILLFLLVILTVSIFATSCNFSNEKDESRSELQGESLSDIPSDSNGQNDDNVGGKDVKTIYVDANFGDDGNSGAKDAPYKTISEAVSHLNAGDILIVKDGTYREKITFTSGDKDAPVTVKAEDGAHPVITGCDLIDADWTLYSGNVYVADVSNEVVDLFVNGKQMNLARWPDTAVDDPVNMTRAKMQSGSGSDTIVDSNMPNVDLTGARVNMVPGSEYLAYSRIIESCQPGKSITFAPVRSEGGDPEGYDPFVPKSGNKYYIVDSLALLDAPGEWYYDKNDKKLYLYTENGDSPENYEISHRTRKHGIDISSSEYVHISGIDLIACAVDGKNARHCVLDGVSVSYGDYFIDGNAYESMSSQRSNHLGGEGNVWKNSKITKSAGNGILITGKGNTVDNCHISDVNWSAGYFANVTIEGEDNTVKNCTLVDSGRFIIYHSTSVRTKIMNNEIKGCAMLTSDCGAIYAWGTSAKGSEIAYNYIHDNNGVGVYIDNNCSEINVHHNIITDNSVGIQLNSQLIKCMIVNNTIAGNDKLNLTYCYPADIPSMEESIIANNLHTGAWDLVRGDNEPVVKNNMKITSFSSDFSLSAGHEAIDAGCELPPYTDGYKGSAPDIGALESGTSAFNYGSTVK